MKITDNLINKCINRYIELSRKLEYPVYIQRAMRVEKKH